MRVRMCVWVCELIPFLSLLGSLSIASKNLLTKRNILSTNYEFYPHGQCDMFVPIYHRVDDVQFS